MFERGKTELCPHGNVPEGCGACKLTLEEAQGQANTMRVMTGQGVAGAKERARTHPVDAVSYEASSEAYESADKQLEGFERIGKHYSGGIFGAIESIEHFINGDPFPTSDEIARRHQEAYKRSMERGEEFSQEKVNRDVPNNEWQKEEREKKLRELYEKLKTRFEGGGDAK